MTMKKQNSLIRSAALILAALALAGCAGTQPPVPEPKDAQPAAAAAASEKLETPAPEPEQPAEEEKEPDKGTQAEQKEAAAGEPSAGDLQEQTAEPQPTEPPPAEEPAQSPQPKSEPEPTPAPEEVPTLEPVPEAAQEPALAPAPAYGAVPFELAAGTGKWWSIDSSDSAYWAMAEQINAVRAAGGLPALAMDGNLSAIASSRCESFVAGGPFDHSGMVTTSEICAAGPLGSASAACAAWQASETHYANIMRTDISSMGIGCWFCDDGGNRYTYWTVTFG